MYHVGNCSCYSRPSGLFAQVSLALVELSSQTLQVPSQLCMFLCMFLSALLRTLLRPPAFSCSKCTHNNTRWWVNSHTLLCDAHNILAVCTGIQNACIVYWPHKQLHSDCVCAHHYVLWLTELLTCTITGSLMPHHHQVPAVVWKSMQTQIALSIALVMLTGHQIVPYKEFAVNWHSTPCLLVSTCEVCSISLLCRCMKQRCKRFPCLLHVCAALWQLRPGQSLMRDPIVHIALLYLQRIQRMQMFSCAKHSELDTSSATKCSDPHWVAQRMLRVYVPSWSQPA
jgi:hypothetical protein